MKNEKNILLNEKEIIFSSIDSFNWNRYICTKNKFCKARGKKRCQKVGTAVKDGAEWTGKTAEKGYDATKKGVKNAAKWTKKTAKKGADAVDKSYQNVKADIKKD
uniref:Uncharacterized protein n=1 Tax=Chryseobacterium endophyticum TaxID=1854762 RepID=A0AAU6WSE4_9FLAO